VSPEALTVLTSYSTIWAVLFPENVRRAVTQLVWEVRWDGPKNRFTVALDETAVAEAHARMKRDAEERASKKARPRRRTRRLKSQR
jgi:hypothetical protein